MEEGHRRRQSDIPMAQQTFYPIAPFYSCTEDMPQHTLHATLKCAELFQGLISSGILRAAPYVAVEQPATTSQPKIHSSASHVLLGFLDLETRLSIKQT